jgi:cold shock CspA family protein
MMSAPRHSGTLTTWLAPEDSGEITPAGTLGPLSVRGEALRQGGIKSPAAGMAVTFEVGDIGGGVTGATNIERG